AVHDNQLAAVHVVTPSKHISSESVETQKSDIITPENKDEATRLSDAQNKQREDLEQLKMENERLERQNEELIRTFAHTKKSSISIGLMADAGLVNQSMVTGSTNQNVYLSVSDVNYESSTTDARGIKLYSSNDLAFIAKPSYSYNHKHPLSIGLSFAKNYTSRVALVTGLNYTKLSADVTDEVDNRTFQQTIHYLSIPIAIQWTLIQQQHYNYNVYMSVGTAIGRNVSAHIDDQSVSVHGIQVSLNTSLGAQYFLLPHWSIFSEVGYAKFYDDDKRIETYRDTHSTDFTFSFGCRWHL
ncbi:MAG: outer membrane beta-barrel protein, partial [Bacteroidaceae bacterium]